MKEVVFEGSHFHPGYIDKKKQKKTDAWQQLAETKRNASLIPMTSATLENVDE